MIEKHFGSCQCKIVQYEVSGSFDSFFLCHCTYCQKDTGSAHAANLFSSTATLSWIAGEDKVKTFIIPLTRHKKSFCSECGAAVPQSNAEGKALVVPAGGLDSQVTMKPNARIFCASKAAWDENLEFIKKFENFPS